MTCFVTQTLLKKGFNKTINKKGFRINYINYWYICEPNSRHFKTRNGWRLVLLRTFPTHKWSSGLNIYVFSKSILSSNTFFNWFKKKETRYFRWSVVLKKPGDWWRFLVLLKHNFFVCALLVAPSGPWMFHLIAIEMVSRASSCM